MLMISMTPWRRGIGNDCNTVYDAQGSVVADRVGTNDGTLIAAAPDLLAALQGVLRVADRKTVEFDAARAAIAKATYSLKDRNE